METRPGIASGPLEPADRASAGGEATESGAAAVDSSGESTTGRKSARPPTWTQWCLRLLRQTVITFTLYTLSIGPMFWHWFEAVNVNGSHWVAVFYAPLALLCDLIPAFGWLVNRYIEWWIL